MPLDHQTLVAARELGIAIYEPANAIDRLLAAQYPPQYPAPPPIASTPLITITVLVLIGLLALLGYVGALDNTDAPSLTTTIQQVSDTR